jgi:anaerobic magnesium-protoporphyrin IX monomethyl ester cyclase
MNDLPSANYDLIDVPRYFALKRDRQLDYISSTGCHFRFASCADPSVYGRRWVGLAPDRVGAEVESLWHRYAFTDLV